MSLFLLKTLQWLHLTQRESQSPHNGLGGPSGLCLCLLLLWSSFTPLLLHRPPSCSSNAETVPTSGSLSVEHSSLSPAWPPLFFFRSLSFGCGLLWPPSTQQQNLPLAPTIPRPFTCFSPWHLLIWGLYFKFHENKDLFSHVDCCICCAENNAWHLATA